MNKNTDRKRKYENTVKMLMQLDEQGLILAENGVMVLKAYQDMRKKKEECKV